MEPPSRHLTYELLLARFGSRYKWLALSVVATGTIAAVLLSTGFSLAVPALKRHFGVGHDDIQWVVTAFLVANAIAMLPSAWLIERYGMRRCFIAATATLAGSIVFGALSPNFPVLIAMRIVQGGVAGILMPMGAILVMRLFPPDEQGRASGVLGFGVTIAPALAPAFGGLLIDHFGWQALLLMSLPFCALAGLAGFRYLPLKPPQRAAGFDWPGAGALAGITLALLLVASSVCAATTMPIWPILGGVVALAVLAWFLRHTCGADAIVTREVLRRRAVAMGMALAFAYGFAAFWSTYLIPVFLQTVRGFSAAQAGTLLLPGGLALALALPAAGMLSDRVPAHMVVMAGLFTFTIALVALWQFAATASERGIVGLTILERVGVALLIAPLNKVSLRSLAGRDLGQGAMIVNYTRMLGGFFGIALLAAYVEARQVLIGVGSAALGQAFGESLLIAAAVLAVATIAAWRIRE